MDICMFSPFSCRAPSSYRLLSFARVLTEKGHNVTVVLPSYDRYSGFKVESIEETSGVRLLQPFQLKTKKLAVNMAPYAFSSILSSFKIKADVIHVLKPTPMSTSGYAPKFFRGIPTVQDIDDLDHVVMKAEKHSGANTWVMEQCERIIPRFADKIVVSCSPLKQLYTRMGLRRKITEIPNGVFVDEFAVDRDDSLKEKYSLREKVVVYVGSLNNEAQLHPLILAMQKIAKERKDVSCLIVGDGIARKNLQQLAGSLGVADSIVFTGKVPHSMVPRYLSISDVGFACFPKLDYLKYASNIKVFEYLAAGVPPLVNDNCDMPLYVGNGNAGLIVSPLADEIAKAIIDIFSDERRLKKLAYNARIKARNYDWHALTEKLIGVYEN